MALNAARRGLRVIGVTLSREQADWGRQMIAQHGMHNLAEIRYQDYRNVTDSAFDAVSKLRPGGRLLNHCITRPTNSGPSKRGLSSIDMCSRTANSPDLAGSSPPCRTTAWTSVIPDKLREHYALTLREWSTNLREHWNACVGEVGVGTARVWGSHMAASRLAFERNAVQLHQVLAVRPTDKGDAAVRCRFGPTITALVARGERTVIAA
jgi:cyclopropane-fatty-acyl-phospholipid synthase